MSIKIIGNTIDIDGEVNTITKTQELKGHVRALKNKGEIKIIFRNAKFITSSLLGVMLKLVKVDGIKVQVEYTTDSVHEMLTQMQLVSVFNAKRI